MTVNPGGVKTDTYSMWPYTGYGLLASLAFINRKGHHSQTCRPKTTQGRECSLINHFCWVLHNPPNNIYLMACRSTRGVGLLRGTQEHGHCYNLEWYTEAVRLTRESKQIKYWHIYHAYPPTLISSGKVPFLSFNSLSSLFLEPFLFKGKIYV